MKTLVGLKPYYGTIFSHNKIFSINNGHNIFFKFNTFLNTKGIKILTIDSLKGRSADRYIYCDAPYPWEFSVWLDLITHIRKNVLFCIDSPIVTPFSHLTPLHILFPRVWTWDDTKVDNKKYYKFFIPQLSSEINTKAKPFKNKKFLVLINANKSSLPPFKFISKYKADLYQERLKILDYFENNNSNLFSLYGKGWNKRKTGLMQNISKTKVYKTYKGEIPNGEKIKVLSNFKFCICFENSIAPGYITEKIFDCLKARCIPIYWGAPNITDYVNKSCFIDYRDFKNMNSLIQYLDNISEKTYNTYINAIEDFLNNKKTKDIWFESGFRKTFLNAVNISA